MNFIEINQITARTGVHISFDYLTLTFPFICHEEDYELKIVEEVVAMVTTFMKFPKHLVSKDEYNQTRYRYQYTIGENIILRLVGPELKSGHASCTLEMRGQGCREFETMSEENSWHSFLEFFIIRLNSQITRLDIAIDDFEGKDIDLPFIKRRLDQKNFNSCFQKKFYRLVGS